MESIWGNSVMDNQLTDFNVFGIIKSLQQIKVLLDDLETNLEEDDVLEDLMGDLLCEEIDTQNQQLFHLIHFLNGYTDYELHQSNLMKDLTTIRDEIGKNPNNKLLDKWRNY